jgi:PPOX class probable F420-dependent enzyme
MVILTPIRSVYGRTRAIQKQKYLNLETFRRNGESIKTPVWFVQDGNILYVQTVANSGKVKRIRNNGNVNIVPCKVDGTPSGPWASANAREVTSVEIANKVSRMMEKKYGLIKKLLAFQATRQRRKDTILEINLVG